jgi:hypothetical protein
MDSRQQTRRSRREKHQGSCIAGESSSRLVNSGNELLWVESVGVEERSGGRPLQLV